MPVETLSYVYTSENEITRLISQTGVALRVSDLTGTEKTTYWVEVTEEASDFINQYCTNYDPADMADSRWVRSRATWIALVLLCRRRANPVPDSIIQRYEEILEELRLILAGVLQIPRLDPVSDTLPTMSNQRVDDRFRHRKLRTNPTISVGRTTPDQDLDWLWTYDWF
jgi:hypothetical protein